MRSRPGGEPYHVTYQPAVRSPGKPQMEAVVTRYLATRSLTDQPATVKRAKRELYQFIDWLAQAYPLPSPQFFDEGSKHSIYLLW